MKLEYRGPNERVDDAVRDRTERTIERRMFWGFVIVVVAATLALWVYFKML